MEKLMISTLYFAGVDGNYHYKNGNEYYFVNVFVKFLFHGFSLFLIMIQIIRKRLKDQQNIFDFIKNTPKLHNVTLNALLAFLVPVTLFDDTKFVIRIDTHNTLILVFFKLFYPYQYGYLCIFKKKLD